MEGDLKAAEQEERKNQSVFHRETFRDETAEGNEPAWVKSLPELVRSPRPSNLPAQIVLIFCSKPQRRTKSAFDTELRDAPFISQFAMESNNYFQKNSKTAKVLTALNYSIKCPNLAHRERTAGKLHSL
jgi:hypothetical protein